MDGVATWNVHRDNAIWPLLTWEVADQADVSIFQTGEHWHELFWKRKLYALVEKIKGLSHLFTLVDSCTSCIVPSYIPNVALGQVTLRGSEGFLETSASFAFASWIAMYKAGLFLLSRHINLGPRPLFRLLNQGPMPIDPFVCCL